MKQLHLLLFSLLVGLGLATTLHAQTPRVLSYQGILANNNNAPVPDGAYTLTLTLYDQLTGGNLLWTESQSVTTKHGVFAAMLGSVTPFPTTLLFGAPYFLGVAIQGNAELTPRTPLLSVPFAIHAIVADSAIKTGPFGSEINTQLAAGVVHSPGTGTDLTSGSVVLPSEVSGILPVANGGTGLGSLEVGSLVYGASGNPMNVLPIGSANKILTSAGTAPQWSSVESLAWGLTGNAGTTFSTNFIGTTDSVNLQFRANNVQAGLIEVGRTNTGLGYGVLRNNTTGTQNTAHGYLALASNTTGFSNTANGNNTLAANTSGTANTAVGSKALSANTTGSDNTATGSGALQGNTAGSENTANGFDALLSGTGSNNTALGSHALALNNGGGSNNTACGEEALYANTLASSNTAIGFQSLASNTTGYQNTASGSQALHSNTTGYFMTASGFQALYSNTTGMFNTATGYWALYDNTSGYSNVATGISAMQSNTTGHHNVATGGASLKANSTGTQNTAVGDGALGTNTTGSGNTAIGYLANVGSSALTNATAIGANARVDQSNAVILGSSADVGIRTSAPQSELDIGGGGTITLTARNTDPSTPATGTWRLYMYVNGTTKQLRVKSPAGAVSGFNVN